MRSILPISIFFLLIMACSARDPESFSPSTKTPNTRFRNEESFYRFVMKNVTFGMRLTEFIRKVNFESKMHGRTRLLAYNGIASFDTKEMKFYIVFCDDWRLKNVIYTSMSLDEYKGSSGFWVAKIGPFRVFPSSPTYRKGGMIPIPSEPAVGKAWRLTGDRRLAPTGRGC